MVKRAMVAGLNAAGINVRDLRVATPAVSRFTTQKTRSMGGIHVAALPGDAQSLEIHFFDKHGLDISPAEQRKVERLYFRGEFRRAFFDAVGEIIYPPRPLEYYSAALEEVIGDSESSGWVAQGRCRHELRRRLALAAAGRERLDAQGHHPQPGCGRRDAPADAGSPRPSRSSCCAERASCSAPTWASSSTKGPSGSGSPLRTGLCSTATPRCTWSPSCGAARVATSRARSRCR